MFYRHFKDFDHERCAHDGFGRERGFGRHWRGGGFEPREGRMFDSGDLKLVILALVAEKPRHGYEIIKALERAGRGRHSPSPGVVYPTLTLIEEMGYATAAQDQGGRKLYTLTPRARRSSPPTAPRSTRSSPASTAPKAARRGDFAPLLRAMENLRMAVRLRVRRRDAAPAQIQAIADALDAAAKAIERV